MVWLCAGALLLALAILVALLTLLGVRGLNHFWPQPLVLFSAQDAGSPAQLGFVVDRQDPSSGPGPRVLLHRGGDGVFTSPLVWVSELDAPARQAPPSAVVVERHGKGPLFGFLDAVSIDGEWRDLARQPVARQLATLEALKVSAADAVSTPQSGSTSPGPMHAAFRLRLSTGELVSGPIAELRLVYAPNAMDRVDQLRHFLVQLRRFLTEAPREGNVEGGVFPAIVGTVTLVLLMTVLVTPLGVLAAIYLQEYAQRGPLTQAVRIAVNNLAGVPSVVYGVFGLGFFVYGLGGSLDSVFFDDRLPAPTLGTPGMLWAALTMALLTLPVVVVTTEEGLARVPAALREGSFALGATRAETLWNVVLPAASPAVLTGLILAIARATGEVAPLLLVGVAKYAPGLPVDGEFPYLHLDRQFMHLGFYIYDLGFQSPDSVTAEGLVFATALLLVGIVLLLNTAAVILRGRLREAFRPDETL